MARTWKQVRKALRRNGIEIQWRGSEAKLVKTAPDGSKVVHILQHHCCKSPSSVVWSDHLAAMKRKFGLTDDDLR